MKKNEKMMEKFKDCDFSNIKKHEEEYIKRVKEQFKRNVHKERSKT